MSSAVANLKKLEPNEAKRVKLERANVPYSPRKLLHSFNFFRWHVVVGLILPVVSAGIFVACDTGSKVAYIDALFMCTSALTLTGLTTILLADLSFGQQFILYLLFQFGSIQSVSLITLFIRRATFNKRFSDPPVYFPSLSDRKTRTEDLEAAEEVLNDPETGAQVHQGDDHDSASNTSGSSLANEKQSKEQTGNNASGRGGFPNPVIALVGFGTQQLRQRFRSNADVESTSLSHYTSRHPPHRTGTTADPSKRQTHPQADKRRKELEPRFGRNSKVQGKINEEQHCMLAKLEISAMTFLLWATLLYWLIWQLVAVIMWAPYFSSGKFSGSFSESPNTSKTWYSVFQAASFFNNCGLTLVDTSLTQFQTCYIMLIPGLFMMIAGNLGYPIGLRATIWAYNALQKPHSPHKQLTNFILEHPRRLMFYLFPPYETLALVIVVGILTSIDWVFFYILDIGYEEQGVFAIVPAGARVINGLVQSAAVRSAGFYVVSLYDTAPALHILYLFMMVFAIYPIAMAIRATNVYEEKSLGLSEDDEVSADAGLQHLKQEEGYVSLHLRDQLAYDVWYIIMVVFLICIVERAALEDPATSSFGQFSIFDLIFECCSAYANAGLSIGSPSSNTSTSGSFRVLSKLILCVTMVRGRTRGLPVLVDRSIMTPRQLDRHGDPPETGMQSEKPAQEAEQQADS